MTKSISIVIPVYNEANRLADCLQSIARQTVAPDEVIVEDNNSTDTMNEVVKDFAFVRVIAEKKQGIVYARNTGFDAASSDIIARIDADTLLPTDWLQRLHRFYDGGHHEQYALTGGGYFYNLRWRRFNGWIQSQLAYRLNRFVVGYYILWGSNMALPKAAWWKVRDDVCLRNDIHEDLDLSIHLHSRGIKITYHSRLRVGVYLKRVFSDREQVFAHMARWPQSLHIYGYKLWWLGIVGNWFLWYLMRPLVYGVEYTSRLLGQKPLGK